MLQISKIITRSHVIYHIWWVLVVKTPKFHLNAYNFWQNYSNLIKLAFLDSSRQDLSNDL